MLQQVLCNIIATFNPYKPIHPYFGQTVYPCKTGVDYAVELIKSIMQK